MTATEKSPTILTEVGARRLTARIRDALVLADDLLMQAWRGRAWEALGHTTWDDYCRAELPELRALRLTPLERQERVTAMREQGMSLRAIAAVLGVSPETVRLDLAGAGPDVVMSLDGRNRPARAPRPAAVPDTRTSVQRAVAHVAAQGERGLSCLELEEETGWRHGAASAALCRAERRGLVRRVPTFRRGYAAYIVT